MPVPTSGVGGEPGLRLPCPLQTCCPFLWLLRVASSSVLRPSASCGRNVGAPILSLPPSSPEPGWGVCFHCRALGFGAPPAGGRPCSQAQQPQRKARVWWRAGGRDKTARGLVSLHALLAAHGTVRPGRAWRLWGLLPGGPARAEHGSELPRRLRSPGETDRP